MTTPLNPKNAELVVFQNHNLSLPLDSLPLMRIVSWGHRRGPLVPPPQVSIDLRRLPNPPKQVRTNQTGLSGAFRDSLFALEAVQHRFERVCLIIRQALSEAGAAGVETIIVGVNCELGKHRSVAFAEELGRIKWNGWKVVVSDVRARLGLKALFLARLERDLA
ncbi:hypothetical protein BDZ94DRAFT_1226093 [Collybia nuda]|uniref:RapZ C-terminal domain-containing protein n=1 Tax=Collybia nuda TaxID=64659 RepID=A0A9P5XWY7_9AGAR|nr:hypothetical protein BDZ94DRAFT_1226093 [Collybia nuda]